MKNELFWKNFIVRICLNNNMFVLFQLFSRFPSVFFSQNPVSASYVPFVTLDALVSHHLVDGIRLRVQKPSRCQCIHLSIVPLLREHLVIYNLIMTSGCSFFHIVIFLPLHPLSSLTSGTGSSSGTQSPRIQPNPLQHQKQSWNQCFPLG